jgi:hypothetical protein
VREEKENGTTLTRKKRKMTMAMSLSPVARSVRRRETIQRNRRGRSEGLKLRMI